MTSPIAVKVLLAELNVISSATLRLPLCQDELAEDHGLQAIDQRIQQWLLSQTINTVSQMDRSDSDTALHSPLEETNLRELTS